MPHDQTHNKQVKIHAKNYPKTNENTQFKNQAKMRTQNLNQLATC